MAYELAIHEQPLVVALAEGSSLDAKAYISTICRTVIKGTATPEQIMAGLAVAKEYGLNPILREMYFFPTQDGGIQPVVGVDGWIKKAEQHSMRNGEKLDHGEDEEGKYCEATIYRKDRDHPTIHREYLHENVRNTPAWKGRPRRMLGWRAMIQGFRIAYNLMPGVMETDEAEAYVEAKATVVDESKRLDPTAGTQALKEAVGMATTSAAGGEASTIADPVQEPAATTEAGVSDSLAASPSEAPVSTRTCPHHEIEYTEQYCPACVRGES